MNVTTDEEGKPLNKPAVSSQVATQEATSKMYSESVQKQQVGIDIITDQKETKVRNSGGLADVKLKSTRGGQ